MEGLDQLIRPRMELQDQLIKLRAVKADSEESWDFFQNQANNQGCPGIMPPKSRLPRQQSSYVVVPPEEHLEDGPPGFVPGPSVRSLEPRPGVIPTPSPAEVFGTPPLGAQHGAPHHDVVGQIVELLDQQQATFATMMEALQRNSRAPMTPRFEENREADILGRFLKLRPSSFSGAPDPVQAEYWMNKMEKMMNLIECTDDQRVKFVVHMLEGEADIWWKNMKKKFPEHHWTWTEFQKTFYGKYFPSSYHNEKVVQFLKLEQGSMSVAQYEAQFAELSRYVPKVVKDEVYILQKFKEGLRQGIQSRLCAVDFTDFADVVDKAMRVEKDFERLAKIRAPFKDSVGKIRPIPSAPQAPEKRMKITPPAVVFSRPARLCHHCGKAGHIAQYCYKKLQAEGGISPQPVIKPPQNQIVPPQCFDLSHSGPKPQTRILQHEYMP